MTAPALTVEQVAARLSMSRGAVYAAVQRGELPCIRLGRAVRIPALAIERLEQSWLDSSSTGANGMPPSRRKTASGERPLEPLIVLPQSVG